MKEGRRISFFLLLSSFSLSVFFILYVRKEAGGGEVLEGNNLPHHSSHG